ncbi:sugar phosphate isomerase/epimerase family protein [Nocardiopsis xinjiangensis]|uniref:sugar phosphate isomerase/epimerase family protein n=1 Tax=Nocardiopsis xinjiangensis TaxID=124285 RepID=UPI000349554C|nr:sugar phosphate isomerase/epimerase family protein [Nocardiopsis xinjiangensis]
MNTRTGTPAPAEPEPVDIPSGRPADLPTPAPGDPRIERLSLNQATVKRADLARAVDGCLRAGVPSIGLWREHVAEAGQERAERMVREAGLRVSSYCRGGFLTDPARTEQARESNLRAIDEAAAFGAATLVLVVGGLPDGERDLRATRARMAEELEYLVPRAADRGVKLGLEPLHPMFCADRAVLSTLGQALDLAKWFPPETVGVVVDTYHLWWDPDVYHHIERAGALGRIASFQVCDWLTPIPDDPLLGRGMVGDGHIDVRSLHRAVRRAGYEGDVEVEIFNADVWAADSDQVIDTMVRRHVQYVL